MSLRPVDPRSPPAQRVRVRRGHDRLLGADRRGAPDGLAGRKHRDGADREGAGRSVRGSGAAGTIVFGIWLAFSYGGYDIWDSVDHRRDRLVGDRRRHRRAHRQGVHEGNGQGEELQAAGQTGPNAELLAINRTQTGLVLHTTASVATAADPHRHDLEAGRMTTLLAVSRPTEWNFPLFVHVLGAMILVGGLLTGASTLLFARGDTLASSGSATGRSWPSRPARLRDHADRRAVDLFERKAGDDLPAGVDDPTWLRHRLHRAPTSGAARPHRADPRRNRGAPPAHRRRAQAS